MPMSQSITLCRIEEKEKTTIMCVHTDCSCIDDNLTDSDTQYYYSIIKLTFLFILIEKKRKVKL